MGTYLVLQGSIPPRTSQIKHILKQLARERLGTRWAQYPFSRCRIESTAARGSALRALTAGVAFRVLPVVCGALCVLRVPYYLARRHDYAYARVVGLCLYVISVLCILYCLKYVFLIAYVCLVNLCLLGPAQRVIFTKSSSVSVDVFR